jgi:hypothetical protein
VRNAAAVVIAALITACSSSGPPAATSAASSPTPTATTAASATPTAAASTTGSVLPPGITDLAQIFKPLASGWRPTGTTLIVARAMVSGDITLVAVPIGPRASAGAPVPIVSFVPNTWALRADGGALAVTVWTGQRARIAIWDIRSGAARWLTPEDSGMNESSPLWSEDGGLIYYASSSDDGRTAALLQIGADGSARNHLRAAERSSGPQGLTPDGKGLVWDGGGAGGTVEILDLATGVSRHLENNARISSWRARQPRALLQVGGCCAGRPGGELVLWDDVAMTSRVVAARGPSGDPAWGGAAWDPAGTRIAAVRFDGNSPYEGSLVVIDTAGGGASQAIPDTKGAGQVLWLAEGIVFTRPLRIGMEVMLLPDAGGPAVSLYQDSGLIQRIEVPR